MRPKEDGGWGEREDPEGRDALGRNLGSEDQPRSPDGGVRALFSEWPRRRQMIWKARQCPRNIHTSKPISDD